MAQTKKSAAKKPAAKKAAPKKPAGKAASKKSTRSSAKRAPNPAFMQPLTPSETLSEVVGAKPLPRTEVVKKVWDYIKKNDLQDSKDRRMINGDEKLKKVFGKAKVSMFEMTKIINQHLK